MREVDNFLHKESEKLYQLLKGVQANRKLHNTVWENFSKKSKPEAKQPPIKTYFKRHPKHISTSSSEVLSPHEFAPKSTKLTRFKPHDENTGEELRRSQSDSSVDVVTVRQEIDLVHTEYWRKVPGNARWGGGGGGEGNNLGQRHKINREREKGKGDVKKICAKKSEKVEKVKESKEITEINIEAKLNNVLDKTLKCMEDIRILIDTGIITPDGDDDFDRRRKRSVEFASRFSRNYLYQLNRQVNDILQITMQLSGDDTNKMLSIRQKLVTSYQTLLQGLQAYYNHLPVSITNAVPEKVRELLKLTSSLCEIHRTSTPKDLNSNEKEEIIDVFEVRSRSLLEKINEKFFCPQPLSVRNITPMESSYAKTGNKSLKKKKNPKDRLAMYSLPGANEEVWRRACASLARKKFNVTSKYRTANFKHRPPIIERQPTPSKIAIKPNKVVEKTSSGKIKSTKTTLNDDNIPTLVQWHKDSSEPHLSSSEITKKNSKDDLVNPPNSRRSSEDNNLMNLNLTNLINHVVNTIKEENKDVSQNQVKNILQALLDCVGGVQEVVPKSQPDLTQTEDLQEKKISKEKIQNEDVKNENIKETINEEEEIVLEKPEREKKIKFDDFDEGILDKVLEAVQRNQESIRKAKDMCGMPQKEDVKEENVKKDDDEDFEKDIKPERKKSVTITGVKNAKLICIKDEEPSLNSLNEIEENILNPELIKKIKDDECLNKSKEIDVMPKPYPDRISKIKISRLPKCSLKCLKMLPRKYALDILEYKVNYGKARKGNHMYKKSATKHPWIVMGDIADTILDELIKEIGLEIQVNGVIDNIYASEFAQ
ncbi:putative leucine-rich repeat-containing protein DDB_G0290503 [Onthophagus taurus]|uniref:putative leucine-rich repeat-containing protein DDB_G0290503 n=1 Tax=Onthophagus taurus TaxID=166361 RepID=UPI000C20CF37|nr:uncharacterized protein LOC111426157 [Onthophagus taurus]